jgi:hypothetical protein
MTSNVVSQLSSKVAMTSRFLDRRPILFIKVRFFFFHLVSSLPSKILHCLRCITLAATQTPGASLLLLCPRQTPCAQDPPLLRCSTHLAPRTLTEAHNVFRGTRENVGRQGQREAASGHGSQRRAGGKAGGHRSAGDGKGGAHRRAD